MARLVLAACLVVGAVRLAAATTVTFIDTTGDVGRYASLAIGSDGLGLIAYEDSTNRNLKVVHCSNTACTAGTIATLDSAGDLVGPTSTAIGSDGRGIIAYFDLTQFSVKTAHCNDLACTSAAIRVIEPAFTSAIAMTIASDGLPLLAYLDSGRLHTAHCTVLDCSTVTISDLGPVTGSQSIAIARDANGLGVIAVERQIPGPVDVRRCLNVACSAATAGPPPGTAGIFIQPRSLVVPADGRPLIGYRYSEPNVSPQVLDVRMDRCTDATCATQQRILTYRSVTGPGIALQSNGFGWFVYGDLSGRLVQLQCSDAACTSQVASCVQANPAFYTSLARGTDGRSLVAFYASGSDLAVAHDVTDPCALLSMGDTLAFEDRGTASFAISLAGASPVPVVVQYATVDGTAVAGQDYVPAAGTLTIPPGTVTGQVFVTILADGIHEPDDETFSLEVSSVVGAGVLDGQGVATIVDTDFPPRIVAGDCERTEGDAGTQPCVLPLSLEGSSTQSVTVDYATADGTATAGADYLPSSGTVTFAPFSTGQTVSVSVMGDLAIELDETFSVGLSNAVNGTILGGTGTVTILDDDAPSLSSLELTHGARVSADLAAAPGPIADQDLYRLAQGPYSSWEIVVDEVSGDVAPGLFLERLAEDNSTVLQTGAAYGSGPAQALRWQRRAATPEVRQHIRVRSTTCTTDCGADDTYRLRVYETTGAIPRFNNSSTQVTVLVLQNATDQTVQAHADFWNASGALLATVPVPLAPHAIGLVNAATVLGLAGQSGSITVTHDGPFGGLVGKSVALEPATGFSFDSPMATKPR